jgi:predicted metal-dependent hydrolase
LETRGRSRMMGGMFRRLKPPPPAPTLRSFETAARRIEFLWVRGTGRRLRIDVLPAGQVRVHSPARMSFDQVLAFVIQKTNWVIRTLDKVAAYKRIAWPEALSVGDEFIWAGRRLRVEEEPGSRFSVRIEDERVVVARPPGGDPERRGRRVVRSLKEEAERTLRRRLAECLPLMDGWGIPAPRLSIRTMKRRWGSCGRDGRVVLNLRLAQMPPVCIDYVILHELCHLRHHHHGREFYALLAHVLPDWKERKKILERTLLV